MSVQASSLMAAIAALTSFVWRTVIENRMPWRRHAPMTLPDQNPESPAVSAARLPGPADPTGQLVDEPLGPAGGVGRAGAHPQVQHLTGIGPAGQQRVVTSRRV